MQPKSHAAAPGSTPALNGYAGAALARPQSRATRDASCQNAAPPPAYCSLPIVRSTPTSSAISRACSSCAASPRHSHATASCLGHFTASAFVLSPDASSLLLIHHAKLLRWLQPGGHVELGDESLLHAARRELGEEAGLDDAALVEPGPFDLDIHDIPARPGEPAHAHFDVRFLFRSPSWQHRAGSDARAARWLPLADISAELSDRSVMRAVEKLRAR